LDFHIKDTGIGISKEAQEKIFDVYTQESTSTTRGYEGSGLGLSIVNGFLKILGGTIRLNSEKGKGTEFFISIPINNENEIARKTKQSKTFSTYKDERLPVFLIVEDDFANYTLFETILEPHASQIFYARNGLEAIEICQLHPEISMVLMDIKMPVMNGFEATKEIKKIRKDLPVIALTAYAMSGDEHKIYEAGCDDYIPKPAKAKDILDKIAGLGFNIKDNL